MFLNILYLLFFFLLLEFFLRHLDQKKNMQGLLGLSAQGPLDRLSAGLEKNKKLGRLLAKLSLGFSFMPYQKQVMRKAQLLLLIFLLLALALCLFLLLIFWGQGLVKAALVFFFSLFSGLGLLLFLCQKGRMRLAKKLPTIYRLLSSFYLVSGDMQEALGRLIKELPHHLQGLFSTLLAASLQNDEKERRARFLYLMHGVDLEYFTLLIYIVDQAMEKGGKEAIEGQFVSLAKECLLDLEYKRQVLTISRSYQLLYLLLALLFFLVPSFNRALLFADQMTFYGSEKDQLFTLVFVFLLLLSFALTHYLERGR